MKPMTIANYTIQPQTPLTLMAGPCMLESEAMALSAAESLKKIALRHGIQLIFKSSYDKANRSSIHSQRGVGLERGMEIFTKVKELFNLPIVTDIHLPHEAEIVAKTCEVLQIPAFLCRQTDLLVAAAETGAVVSVKKGQFLAPWDMETVVGKIRDSGNERIILTDRGTMFGYNNLISDMRGIPIMKKFGYPVCFDASHSVQLPGGHGTSSGGQKEFIPTLAKSALAAGADLLFIETHPDPEHALSDRESQLSMQELDQLLEEIVPLYNFLHRDKINHGF